jgi:hypothetical protein
LSQAIRCAVPLDPAPILCQPVPAHLSFLRKQESIRFTLPSFLRKQESIRFTLPSFLRKQESIRFTLPSFLRRYRWFIYGQAE